MLNFAHQVNLQEYRPVRTLSHIPRVPHGTCPGCQQQATGDTTEVGGNVWHSRCLKCSLCRRPFEEDCIPKGDLVLHRDCYMECFCPRCSICTRRIPLGQEITAHGKHFHPGCFACINCGDQDVQGGRFILAFGLPYCGRCFEQAMRHVPKCCRCKKLVLPEQPSIEFFFQSVKFTVHTPCAVCNVCQTPLTPETATAPEGIPVCRTCFAECQQRICVACNATIYERDPPSVGGLRSDCQTVYFHAAHFRCIKGCAFTSQNRPRYENGVLWCSSCARKGRWNCPTCGKTGENDIANGLFACGTFWHTKCFGCQFCRQLITDMLWVELRGQPCCAGCLKEQKQRNLVDERGRLKPGAIRQAIAGAPAAQPGTKKRNSVKGKKPPKISAEKE